MNGPQATFFGRLTQDPQELRYTANGGVPYVKVNVAVNTYRGPDEEQEVHYYNVTLWRRHAENAINRCRKGQEVYVQGQYSFREYTRRDGRQGYSHEVNAREFHYSHEQARERSQERSREQEAGTAETTPVGSIEEEGMNPFDDDLESMEY